MAGVSGNSVRRQAEKRNIRRRRQDPRGSKARGAAPGLASAANSNGLYSAICTLPPLSLTTKCVPAGLISFSVSVTPPLLTVRISVWLL